MKKLLIPSALGLAALIFLSGCIVIGNRGGLDSNATLGQQLIDLQKAKDSGLLTDEQYKAQRHKLLKE